jgi:hypothetical protein
MVLFSPDLSLYVSSTSFSRGENGFAIPTYSRVNNQKTSSTIAHGQPNEGVPALEALTPVQSEPDSEEEATHTSAVLNEAAVLIGGTANHTSTPVAQTRHQ